MKKEERSDGKYPQHLDKLKRVLSNSKDHDNFKEDKRLNVFKQM